jgi:Sec-independent protein translocase protein TatA
MEWMVVLIIVLILVIMWRGPKTLPLLGRAFGQGVKEARKEIDEIRSDDSGKEADDPKPSDPKTSDPKTSDPKTSDPKTPDPKTP